MFEKKRPKERGFKTIRMVLMSWILMVDFLQMVDICCFGFLSWSAEASETVLSNALTPTNQQMAAAARLLDDESAAWSCDACLFLESSE